MTPKSNDFAWYVALLLAFTLGFTALIATCADADTIHFRADNPFADPNNPQLTESIFGRAHYNPDGQITYARLTYRFEEAGWRHAVGGKIATRIAPFGERGGHSWGIIYNGYIPREDLLVVPENSWITDESMHLEIMSETPRRFADQKERLILDIDFGADPDRVNDETLTPDLFTWSVPGSQATQYGGHSRSVPEPSALALLLTVIPLWRRLCPN